MNKMILPVHNSMTIQHSSQSTSSSRVGRKPANSQFGKLRWCKRRLDLFSQHLIPKYLSWASGVMYNLFSMEPCALFISAGNCFHFCWSRFLRHEQTEMKANKIAFSGNWEGFGCFFYLHTLSTLHPCYVCDLPIREVWDFLYPWSMSSKLWWEGLGLAASVTLQEQNWHKMLQSSSEFSRWIFLKCVRSKVWIWTLSKSNDTEICTTINI